MIKTIGFIGPGIMGGPMALNLLKAGYAVQAYARRPDALAPLLAVGATACNSPAEAATRAQIVISIVSDTTDVEQVLLGKHGVIEGAAAGTTVIDMSTISPAATRNMAARLAEKHIDMLDAPVSGGETGAINATLSIMVGGKQKVFEQALPVLQCLGKNIVHIGDHGAGQVAKACNQIVVAATIAGVAEALTFARANAVDGGKVREALLGGFAGSKILEVHGQRMLSQDFTPGFKSRLHRKDMNIVRQAAEELGLDLPVAQQLAAQMEELVALGHGELDSSALIKLLTVRTED